MDELDLDTLSVANDLSGLVRSTRDNIYSAYKKGYKMGRKDINELTAENEYRHGIKDAEWAIKKILMNVEDGGLRGKEILEIFGNNCYSVFKDKPMSEIIKKIRDFEEAKEHESEV